MLFLAPRSELFGWVHARGDNRRRPDRRRGCRGATRPRRIPDRCRFPRRSDTTGRRPRRRGARHGLQRHAGIVYKKLDSTLRGPIAAELAAALGASGRDRAVVAPAFPAAGRTTVDGVQLVRGVPVHETEAKNDPRTPVREGHVPTLLAAAFPSVVSLSVEDLADPAAVRRALERSVCIVADAARDEDLEALVRAVPDPHYVLWAGSARLAVALGHVYPGPRAGKTPPPPTPARKVLVVVGSLSGVARGQLQSLAEYGCAAVPVSGAEGEALGKVWEALSGGACAALHSA